MKSIGARVVFDCDGYGTQVSFLKVHRGQSGWLTNNLLSVAALGQQEQHLIVVATTADGVALAEDDPEKLRRLPAANSPSRLWGEGRGEGRDEEKMPSPLNADAQNRKQKLLREINQRNLVYFGQEVEKLHAWADDLKPGLEQEIKAIDVEIK